MRCIAALTLSLAAPVAASSLELQLPIDCTLGDTCFIQQYVDHDSGPDARDFTCAGLTYDGHKGTDIGLPSLSAMQQGVDVLAAAPGIVRGLRDGMKDAYYTPDRAAEIDGRECGNGVVIRHADGWETQYCHLRNGSVSVTKGQQVEAGKKLGEVGLSGRTQFPHAHLSVRHQGAVVDPFDPDGELTCGAPSTDTLWQDPPAYTPGAILNAGFADHVPDYSAVKAGTAGSPHMPATAPALVLWGYAFGGQQRDVMRLTITGPEGEVITHDALIKKDQAQFFRAAGKRLKSNGWPKGRYQGRIDLIREGTIIDSHETTLGIE